MLAKFPGSTGEEKSVLAKFQGALELKNSKESKNLFVLPVLSEKRGQKKRKVADFALFKK